MVSIFKGSLTSNTMDGGGIRSEFNDRYSVTARKMVRIVSANSRAKITEIANMLKISRRTAALKLSGMEKELKIHYILELNEEKLGLNRPHLILVKFKAKPDYAKVAALLNKSHIPQVAASVKGTYDMLIYANALSGTEYAHWDKKMQTLLAPYKVEWHSSEVVHRQLGFFPLRNEIIEKANIKEKYKKILRILNSNSRISFQELAKELDMNVNTAVYNFNNIMRMGYIKSFTISIEPPKSISFMTFFSKYIPAEGYEDASAKARKAFTSDDENSLISRYIITAPLIGSYDFFTLGAFDSFSIGYREDVLHHKDLFRKFGITMLYGEIDRILIGRLPIRSMDTKSEYKTLVWSTD
ncbi:MAG: winged helix-turn-helix transcriptional regulator [Candidatus Micrarchaeota archaeon]|nr:winged helix-turn-helix transcriptional regulator [Candidatus Micrarchaeota archaeon]